MAGPPSFMAEVNSMHYVYVLKSLKNGKRYIGFTSKDPNERLTEHNNGSNIYTRHNGPFKLVYFEQHEDKDFARKRECYFKTGYGRKYLNKIILL
jgi:putative endonuclease